MRNELAVPEELRNLPLREEREDNAVLTWSYETGDWSGGVFTPDPYGEHLRVTALEGTAEHPSGIPGASVWTVEIRDPSGLALRRETRLCDGTAAGPLLAWEESEYDQKGHLLSTAFSDGSALSNLWGCCRLDTALRRDGTRSETWEIPGFPLWSAEAATSLGSLPGADGAYPVTETFRDSAGRVTNTVRSVWKNGQRDPAFARSKPARITRTARTGIPSRPTPSASRPSALNITGATVKLRRPSPRASPTARPGTGAARR